jgi:hypothetical protein
MHGVPLGIWSCRGVKKADWSGKAPRFGILGQSTWKTRFPVMAVHLHDRADCRRNATMALKGLNVPNILASCSINHCQLHNSRAEDDSWSGYFDISRQKKCVVRHWHQSIMCQLHNNTMRMTVHGQTVTWYFGRFVCKTFHFKKKCRKGKLTIQVPLFNYVKNCVP